MTYHGRLARDLMGHGARRPCYGAMITLPNANLLVSFLIATHNRREVLVETLSQVRRCGLSADSFEIVVVDNASTDCTVDQVTQDFPTVRLIHSHRNLGPCAKNLALREARGRFVLFLDDDSHPAPGSVMRMIRKFQVSPRLGAAVFTVHLPDGSRECSAYPDVFIGCGTAFRRRALTQVGGLPDDFFMQAEEYDLSLRLLQGGWDIQTYDDLHVIHMKTPEARRSGRTMRLDVRNNFIVANRYIPDPWRRMIANDWLRRYWLMARARNQRVAFARGLVSGALRSLARGRATVDPDVFEQFTRMHQIETRMRIAADERGIRTVLLIDLGKNILPYWLGAQQCGLRIAGIADPRLAGFSYRGIPIVNDAVARRLEFDAAIISNTSPVHAEIRRNQWRKLDERPVIDLFEPAFAARFIAADQAEPQSHQTAARIA